jgi:predicted nucleic acid-binding protein
MTACLDTSAYSFFRRGHPGVVNIVQTAAQVSLSVVVIGELLAGFRQGTKLADNERALRTFLASPRVRVLVVDATTADRYSEIETYLRQQGTPLPTNDVWIAANAMQHGLQVVTLDKHFAKMPQVSTIVLVP